jgi:hypothetical protein
VLTEQGAVIGISDARTSGNRVRAIPRIWGPWRTATVLVRTGFARQGGFEPPTF